MGTLRFPSIALLLLLCGGCVETSDGDRAASEGSESDVTGDGDSESSDNTGEGDGDSGDDGGADPTDPLCNERCEFAEDGECDDGGPNASFADCALGSDCMDCGRRTTGDSPVGGAGSDGDNPSGDGDTPDAGGVAVCEDAWPVFCGPESCDTSACLTIEATRGEAAECGGNPDSTEVAIGNRCDFEVRLALCFIDQDGEPECTRRTFAAGEVDEFPGQSGFYACSTDGEYRWVAIPNDPDDECILGSEL